MKIIIAPDSFKGTLTAPQVCEIIANVASNVVSGADVVCIPVADGGEGSIDAMLAAAKGKKIFHPVTGPLFETRESYYGLLNDAAAGTAASTAVIELAAICGLMLTTVRNPEKTTTYGVGQMIRHALNDGCRRILLCVGGSATNDAGIGALSALGVRFLDEAGLAVRPTGEHLSRITAIDATGLDERLAVTQLTIACDVRNQLYGENGAAHVFAPQKGADAAMVLRLDAGLRAFAEVLRRDTGCTSRFEKAGNTPINIALIPGSGAAGGITAGFLALTTAVLAPGIDTVLDMVDFDEKIAGADIVITGEGRTDRQTLEGKAVLGVTRRAAKQGIPVVVLSGAVENGIDEALYREGVRTIFPCVREAKSLDDIKSDCPRWLAYTAENMLRCLTVGHNYFL